MTQFSFLCELLTYLWKSFLSRITVSHLVQSYGWWETGEGDMIYVCRVKAIWFIMSAVMLVFFLLWYASQSSDMTAASEKYSCLPNKADTQLQTLSVTPREAKCKRDEGRRWKRAKRKSGRK